MARVTAINLEQRLALLDDGRTVPITNMLDASGDDTNDAAEATGFVARSGREWFAESVADYEGTTIQ